MQKVLEVLKEAERLELGGQFEVGNYEESFLGDVPAVLTVGVSGSIYTVDIDRLIEELKKLQPNDGHLGDIEEVLKKITVPVVK